MTGVLRITGRSPKEKVANPADATKKAHTEISVIPMMVSASVVRDVEDVNVINARPITGEIPITNATVSDSSLHWYGLL